MKPTNGRFYIKYPFLEDFYIRPSEYEFTLVKEKEAAFRKLASSLGAKTITLLDAKLLHSNGEAKVNTKVMDTVKTNIEIILLNKHFMLGLCNKAIILN